MAIRFYSWPMSSGARVQWALEELGISYEYVQLDRTKGEHKAPAYLAINPNGKVPALVDDGVNYFESVAILVHLGERYGVERGLWPAASAAQDRADALSWSVWNAVEMQVYMTRYMWHGLDTRISYKPEERSKAAAEFNFTQTTRCLKMLEDRLATRDHILGSFTLVDVAVGSTIRFGSMMGVKLDAHPHVAAWLARISQRPALAKVR
jgi:glutathione S-transferase